jgi:hypothetical protein
MYTGTLLPTTSTHAMGSSEVGAQAAAAASPTAACASLTSEGPGVDPLRGGVLDALHHRATLWRMEGGVGGGETGTGRNDEPGVGGEGR